MWTDKYIQGWWKFTFNCYISKLKFCAYLKENKSNSNIRKFYISTYLIDDQVAQSDSTERNLPY